MSSIFNVDNILSVTGYGFLLAGTGAIITKYILPHMTRKEIDVIGATITTVMITSGSFLTEPELTQSISIMGSIGLPFFLENLLKEMNIELDNDMWCSWVGFMWASFGIMNQSQLLGCIGSGYLTHIFQKYYKTIFHCDKLDSGDGSFISLHHVTGLLTYLYAIVPKSEFTQPFETFVVLTALIHFILDIVTSSSAFGDAYGGISRKYFIRNAFSLLSLLTFYNMSLPTDLEYLHNWSGFSLVIYSFCKMSDIEVYKHWEIWVTLLGLGIVGFPILSHKYPNMFSPEIIEKYSLTTTIDKSGVRASANIPLPPISQFIPKRV